MAESRENAPQYKLPWFIEPRGSDFKEDSHLENGNYQNICCVCGEKFVGHKRRKVCKICAMESERK